MKKVLYYLNQFFGQIGGEDQADIEPRLVEGAIGPAMAFSQQLEEGEVTHTIICGDNYFNENLELAQQFIMESYNELQPDLVVAGPAFNAGRYGMACAGVANTLKDKTTVLTGMYHENPAVAQCRSHAYIVPTGDSAASMRKALPAMVELATKILAGKEILAEEDGFMMQGRRLTVFSNQTGAERASEMLLKRLHNESYETELPMPEFDYVQAASPITDMPHATIALVTTGGIVPEGNPDHLQSASAQKWVKYDVSNLTQLAGKFITVHGGFDPVYANDKADRIAPLDELYRLKEKGTIGDIYKYFYSTTGTGTSVGNSEKFGREIGQELSDAKVDGVILTSTWGTCTRCGATIVKEIERFGIPIVHMATITTISESVGANRIVPTIAIPYPVGNPELDDREASLRDELVDRAIRALSTDVASPTVFKKE